MLKEYGNFFKAFPLLFCLNEWKSLLQLIFGLKYPQNLFTVAMGTVEHRIVLHAQCLKLVPVVVKFHYTVPRYLQIQLNITRLFLWQ